MTGDGWLRAADRALELATGHIKVIRAVTPTNAERELADLERAFRAGSPRMPRWSYEPAPVPVELCRALVRKGHETTVFASSFSHYRLREEHIDSLLRLSRTEVRDDVRFIWLRGYPYASNDWRRIVKN